MRRGAWLTLLAVVATFTLLAAGCGENSQTQDAPSGGKASTAGGSASLGGNPSGGAGAGGAGAAALVGAPYIFAPTEDSFGVNVAMLGGDLTELSLRVKPASSETWLEQDAPEVRASDIAEWRVGDLVPGTHYDYEVLLNEQDGPRVIYAGSAKTQAPPGQAFRFALLTDSHIPPRTIPVDESLVYAPQEATLANVAPRIGKDEPDFVMNLGDMLDFHNYGFNPPPPGQATREAYLNYRRLLGDTLGNAAHYVVIGNWDGENGDFSSTEIDTSRQERWLYAPGPTPETYPEGGSDAQDYYAFQWGDALFVVLNVMTYTPTQHLLSHFPGVADDWTLGEEQMAFLESTLETATSKWRFLLIHHAVGGAAATAEDSAYGRGGGQAARVGEQSKVHDLMLEHGVQVFFYGHDHVFTDMVVDDIHYTLPGSAGAPWKFDALYTGYDQYWTDSGHARVDVSPDHLKVEFVAETGSVLYSYEL